MAKSKKLFSLQLKRPTFCNFWGLKAVWRKNYDYKPNFHWISPLGQFDLVVAMSVCLSVWCPFSCGIFWGLFCSHFPKSDVQKNLDSKSLGKSAEKKWSQNWTFWFGNGLKSPHKKKLVFCWFSQNLGSKLGSSTKQYLCWSTHFWPLVHS